MEGRNQGGNGGKFREVLLVKVSKIQTKILYDSNRFNLIVIPFS
jgi:hypothetical protein